MSNFSQKNLIFLISQPRAGSTLTQRILGSHQDIYTISEPWIMLHPLYALRSKGYQMEYSAVNSQKALNNFLGLHPQGEEAYFQSVNKMCLNLYEGVIKASGKKYFLDKTPRYYYILPELYRTFPSAKYIFLLRNPLAVLCSIFNTFIQEHWWRIQYYQGDLFKAPSLIAQGMVELQKKSIVISYENLLVNPNQEITKVCNFLNIPFDEKILNYGEGCSQQWQFGDQAQIYQEKTPNSQQGDRWKKDLDNPIIWQCVSNYLEFLGKDLLNSLGYSYEEFKNILSDYSYQTKIVLPPALEDFFTGANLFKDQALQPYLEAVELNPQLFHPYLDLGKALLEKKDFKKALNYLQTALKLAPYVPEIHFLIGENLLGLGKVDQAITYYQKAIELDSKFVQNYDKIESTIIALKQVLQVNPNHQAIANLLDTIKTRGRKKLIQPFN